MTSSRPVPKSSVALALSVVLLGPVLSAPPAEAADTRHHSVIRDRMYYRVNRLRSAVGVRRLRVNTRTQRWARDHAVKMARQRRIYHDSRLKAEIPANSCVWAENVARTAASNAVRSAMTLFATSSAHRSNMLNARLTHMGFGVAKRGSYTYIVQRFVRRC